jgi:hypothetical protein
MVQRSTPFVSSPTTPPGRASKRIVSAARARGASPTTIHTRSKTQKTEG